MRIPKGLAKTAAMAIASKITGAVWTIAVGATGSWFYDSHIKEKEVVVTQSPSPEALPPGDDLPIDDIPFDIETLIPSSQEQDESYEQVEVPTPVPELAIAFSVSAIFALSAFLVVRRLLKRV